MNGPMYIRFYKYISVTSYTTVMTQSPEDHFVIGIVHHARLHTNHRTAYGAFSFSSSSLYKFATSLAAGACNVTQQPL